VTSDLDSAGVVKVAGRRLRVLARLLSTPADAVLVAETVGWMAVLPVLKRVLPLPTLVQMMWRPGTGRPRQHERELHTARVVLSLCRASGGNCLVRSLILYRFLSRANAEPTLVAGMAKPGDFIGHVWVNVDERPLLESTESLQSYVEVLAFGVGGRLLSPS
jgi:Transglutaminase-like superfamily